MQNEQWKSKIQNGVLDLGTMNGWNQETSDLYSYLKQFKIADTESGSKLGSCYNAYEWQAKIDDAIIIVYYKVDSSG
jgi:glucan phosphorylase